MEPPPKRQKLDPPLQNVPLQRTFTDTFRNDLSSTFKGTGISNPHGRIDVGRDVNIFPNAAQQPIDPEKEKKEKRKKLLKSLRFDQIDARHDSIKRAQNQTCCWFLDDDAYKMWEETGSSQANNFLWIKGKPGAGKSTLMKFLHGQIRARTRRKNSSEILISFFFNARGGELEKSTIGLYRSLLWQLLDKRPDLQEVLDELPQDYRWTTSEPLKSLLDDVIQILGETPIFCLIDALDECDQDQIRDMVSFLEELVDAQSSVHVCFASRHYPYITVEKSREIILEQRDDHKKDIAIYLNSALRVKPERLACEIRSTIQEKARGVFIWVVLVVEILNREYDAGRNHRLRERLQQIPGDLHLLFQDILTRDTKDQAGLLLCIQWVLFAKEPLTPRQLYLAILSGTEPEFLFQCHFDYCDEEDVQRYILDISKGLAQPTKSRRPTVQFIHESVRDFLLKENSRVELFDGLRSNLHGESHDALKGCCLAYMRMKELMCLDMDDDDSSKANDYTSNDFIRQFPFLGYANFGVLYHAEKAGNYGISQNGFIANFPRSQWVKQHKYSAIRNSDFDHYKSNVSLFYILAEAGLSELIRAHSCRQSCFEIEDEHYGIPILAALFLNHETAVKVMLELEAERIPGFDFADFCERFKPVQKSKSCHSSRSYRFSPRRRLLQQLIEHADDRVSLFFLESTMECSDFTATTSDALFVLACQHGRSESAKFLVQHCTPMTNAAGVNTPLHQASRYGNPEIVQFILNHGADISATDEYGSTVLHQAAYGGTLQTVQLLVDRGADITVLNSSNLTARQIAQSTGFKDIADFLKLCGS